MSQPQPGANRRLLLAYAEASRDLATPLARALEAAGFEVAQTTAASSDEALARVNAVLVCWTPAAVASDTVNLQAARASKARKLVGILLAPSAPPANLGRPLADLSGWRGDAADGEFLRLVHALHARLSGRLFTSDLWRSRYLSWGGVGAATLGAIAIIANLGDLGQTIDGIANPAASQRDLNATNAKVEEVLLLLKQKSGQTLSADAEAALRQSIEGLLSVQSGARGSAADKLAEGDLAGALQDLNGVAQEGEKAVDSVAQTYEQIGALAFLSDTFASLDAYERANQLAPNNPGTLGQLGSLYIRMGRFDDAQEAFEHLQLLAEGDADNATALGYLGSLALSRGNLNEAEAHFRAALQINERLGFTLAQAADLSELGDTMRQKGQLADAEGYLARAMNIYRSEDDEQGQASVILRMALLARERNLVDDSESAYAEAAAMFERMGDNEGVAAAVNGLGVIAFERGDIHEARTHLARSLDAARAVSAREAEAFALGLWGEIAEREGARTRAIEFYRDAMMIYDQIGLTQQADPLRQSLKRMGAQSHPEGAEN